VDKAMVVNYMSSHDNNTLWDKLLTTNPEASTEQLLAMNRLGAGIVMISKGTPFFLAGEEMLRSKQGDANRYASSDEINNIDWSVLSPDRAAMNMVEYYKALIAMRKANPFLTGSDVTAELLDGNAIQVTYIYHDVETAYALINPNDSEMNCSLPEGSWTLLMDGSEVFPEGGEALSGEVSVPAMGILLVRR
jgi:pullulanase